MGCSLAHIRVLVADDHELVRCGIVRMLSDVEDIVVVGQACSGEEAQNFCRTESVDIILMDIRMPGIGGLETTRRLKARYPDLRVIALSGMDDVLHSRKILEAGAWGYLTKGGDYKELVKAIRDVHSGLRYICANVAQQMAVQSVQSSSVNPFDQLSPKEFQVALMVLDCCKAVDIAEQLNIESKTVNSYRYRIFDKLDVKNDVGLAKLAIRHGIVDLTD